MTNPEWPCFQSAPVAPFSVGVDRLGQPAAAFVHPAQW